MPREKWLDAQNPKHVAISLNGEPTLYTRLSEYMDLCHKHGMTTMLVTNGTLPKVIEKLDTLPTQLYVSVDAPNKKVFDEVCKPKWNSNAWDKFSETLDLLPSLDTRIVCRHTLMKGINMSKQHVNTLCQNNMCKPHVKTTCQHNVSKQHVNTCTDTCRKAHTLLRVPLSRQARRHMSYGI